MNSTRDIDPMSQPQPVQAAALGELAVTPRPLQAYRDMFLLTDDELATGPILDCPAGASPFGAQVRALGGDVVSVDPAYAIPRAELVARARFDADRVADWQRANPAVFDWSYLRSPDAMNRSWREAIEEFAADFAPDSARYAAATLPTLPYPDRHFALAVSGFLLFVYPELLDTGDHLAALLELSRVTRGEVRVYPLHDTVGAPYAALPGLRAALHERGVATELRSTGCSYAPQPGSDLMLACRWLS